MFNQGWGFFYHGAPQCASFTSQSKVSDLFLGILASRKDEEEEHAHSSLGYFLGAAPVTNYIQLARTLSDGHTWLRGLCSRLLRSSWKSGVTILWKKAELILRDNSQSLLQSIVLPTAFTWLILLFSVFCLIFLCCLLKAKFFPLVFCPWSSEKKDCVFLCVFSSFSNYSPITWPAGFTMPVPSFPPHRWWLCHLPLCSCWECCLPFPWAPSGSLRPVPTMGSSHCLKFLLRSNHKFHSTSPWASKYLTCLWAKMALPWARSFPICSMAKSIHICPNIWRKCSRCQGWARKQLPRKAKVTTNPVLLQNCSLPKL